MTGPPNHGLQPMATGRTMSLRLKGRVLQSYIGILEQEMYRESFITLKH